MSLLAKIQTEVEKHTTGYRNTIDSNIAAHKATLVHLRAQYIDHTNAVLQLSKRISVVESELCAYETDLVNYNNEVAEVNSWLSKSEPEPAKVEFTNVGDKTVGEIIHWLATDGAKLNGFYVSNVVCSKSATQVGRVLRVLTDAKIIQHINGTKAMYVVDSSKPDLDLLAKEYPHQRSLVFNSVTTTVVGPGPSSTSDVTPNVNEHTSFTLTPAKQNEILQWRSRSPRNLAACSLVGSIVGMDLASGNSHSQGNYSDCADALTELNLWDYIRFALNKNGWNAQNLMHLVKYRGSSEAQDQVLSQLTASM